MEKVLIQIFERKNRIIDHAKQQILLFDQHLASKCLIDGFIPPPWLLSASPSELNKEDRISGLLLPHPQPSIPYCSLFQQPVVTTDNVQLPHVLCSRIDASNEGLDQWLSGKAVELDPSATSPPQDCRDGMTSDICPDPGLSLARIQRSKSRQRALEHRNSAKACKNIESFEKNVDAGSSQNKGSKIASLLSDPLDKLELIKSGDNVVSCVVGKEERGQCRSKERSDNVFSGRVTGSGSPIEPSKSVSGPSRAGNTSFVAKQDGMMLEESISKSSQQPDGVHELLESKFVKPVRNTVSYAVKNEERGQCRNKGRVEDIYSGRITRSRSSVQPPRSVNSPTSAGKIFPVANGIMLKESINKSRLQPETAAALLRFVKPVDNIVTCVVAKKERGQCQSKERGENIYSCRITRSRSSVQSPKSVNGLSCAGKSSDVAKCDGNMLIESISKSKQQPNVVDELLELVKPTVISDESCGSRKARHHRSKEKENNVYQGRLTRSRSSSQQHNCVNKHLKLDSCPNRSMDDGICKSIQLACHANDLKELIKLSDITDQSCGIKAKTSDNKTKENAVVDQHNDGRTRSKANRSTNLFKPVNSSNTLEYEVTRSKSKASKRSPYLKSSDRSEGVELKEVSGAQANSQICADDSGLADLNQCDVIVADTNTDSDDLVETLSAGSASNLDGANGPPLAKSMNRSGRVEMEVIGTNPHSASAKMVMPRQLDCDDLGEPTLNEASCLVSESEEVIKSLEKKPLTPLPSADKLDEVSSVHYQGKYNSSLEKQFPDERETFSKEEKLSETNLNKTSGPGRTSSLNTDTGMDYVFEKDYEKLEVVKSVMPVPEASNVNADECCGPAISANIYFSGFCSPALLRKADVTSSDAIKHPCAALIEETKGHSVEQKTVSSPSHNRNADSMGRCIADGVDSVLDHAHAKFSENKVAIQSLQLGRHSGSNVGSWPHKRRKTDGQQSNSLSLSLSLKGKCTWKERDRNENTPSISSLPQETLENFEDHSAEKTRAVDSSSIIFGSTRNCTADENQILLNVGDKSECGNIERLTCDERSKKESKSQPGEDGEFSTCPSSSPCQPPTDLINADESRPEIEGFIMQTDSGQICVGGDGISFDKLGLPKTTIERASLLEKLCKSACIHTPLSQFPTTYRLHRTTDLYQSVPNGLLECMELRSTLPENDNRKGQLKVSTSCFGEDMNHTFVGEYFSDCLPFSSSQVTGDVKKPYLSPVGKLWDRIPSNSGSSEKQGSLNPELPCINEENENTDEVVDAFQEGTASEVVTCSVTREPLAEIRECPNIPAPVSGAEKFTVRDSLDSVNTAYSFTGAENGIKQKVKKHNGSKRRGTKKLKENQSILPGENGTKRASESLRNRFSKPKLSEKTSLRKGGPNFSQKESKFNNIVSNVTSFIPIVQQKQAASIITGKRDVKVKALEAAEAAKKLAEKKENDRKMKKEALKLERARLEQKNLRQLEHEKKKKEEERKKKEADLAAKKRQREEEERLEKERKRKRMEDVRRQQRAPVEKLCAKKDEKEKKCQAPDERAQTMKVPNDEAVKHEKMQNEIPGENEGTISEMEFSAAVVSTYDAVKASTAIEDYNAKVMSTMDRATESNSLIADTSQEQSYDISPYKVSDDEEEEEDDDEPNSKFIPSWASKNHVALVVTSQQKVDPEIIFPPESFLSIAQGDIVQTVKSILCHLLLN
ncbi:uncharacterized protein LOC111288554 [Durio zibethinus]|uniref:Uncharacterized protein LOC111288554 n=1 Tax=Durio zibethinus TaxID=66656 RepID=A0A6P5Y5C6_DURZI|nr:uncharacterized protein LOC111288554 [Durio zibethinus]